MGRDGNKTRLNLGLGMGMGMNHWEWEGMGLKKTFPLITTRDLQTAPQVVLVVSVLFGHSYLTHTACIFVDLTIIDIIQTKLKL